eukprot:TRINITY_DN14227_c0_g1_i2.p1 TRINITY_DN14227_c0_g1~~TRINITY_DN14227_c0_g1_i2.p1  ORF type:complete len:414 (+),score=103.00 TRINITY_DN14227_c0_g1_i2:90-1331(+)
MRSFTLLSGLSFLVVACAAQVDYSGHKVFRADVRTSEQADFLVEIRERFDFWTEVGVGRSVDIRCAPAQADELNNLLSRQGIQFSVLVEDVQKLAELVPMKKGSMSKSGHSMDWTDYHPIEDIHSYLDYLETTFDFVTTESIGQSHDGSDMRIAKVCKGGCGNKPAMWIDGGIHAREWISPATVTYILMELVENDADHSDLTENIDWYILPVVNPDGYLYTQTDDRLWRKTRTPNGGGCFGTDANRNWGFHWGTGGSSNNPCADTYMGPEAFSEVENRNVRDFLTANKDNVKFYNNVHSYSQLILLPWGWGYEQPDNYDDLYEMAMKGNDALFDVHGKTFEVGCIPCMLYVASGGSLDWTLGELGIPYSYGMELRDTGNYGFILPPDQIIPSGEEVWAFHMTVARELIKEFVP